MSKTSTVPPGVAIAYSVVWRWLLLSVHRYGSMPTGEIVAVLTIVLLDRYGYHPTVTEVAEITGMPKSSISRYVSDQMAKGFLEEYIDPQDRRRRRLRPTRAARRELQEHWHAEIDATYRRAVSDQDNPTIRDDAQVDEIIAYLKGELATTLPPKNTI